MRDQELEFLVFLISFVSKGQQKHPKRPRETHNGAKGLLLEAWRRGVFQCRIPDNSVFWGILGT